MVATRSQSAVAAPAEEASGLPSWLDDMLKPGVSSGVFTTLKLSLVGLVLTLCMMIYMIEDSVRCCCPLHTPRPFTPPRVPWTHSS